MDDDKTPNEDQVEEEVVEQPQEEAQEELHEEPIEEEQVEDEEEVEQPEEEEQPPSRREQLRIQQLLKKYGAPQQSQAPRNQGINYQDMIDADPEVLEQLGQASQQFGTEQYNAGLQQAQSMQFHTRLEIDAPKVASKYPQLDKDSNEFNPALADSINNMYLSSVGYDPQSGTVQNASVRYADYAEAIMELADEAANSKVASTQKNITRQAARTGLRPDGSSAKRLDLTKTPEAMTDEELNAYIARSGFAPKKR